LTHTTGDELDRTTSGRFVRNLALSLSGGALVTLLGASAAQAQDAADAGTDSAGTGAAQSGDATAVGNQANTNSTQTVTVSGNLGTIQVINQQANVSNVGGAVANTGGNIAIGNTSNNNANADQTGTSGGGPASNSGEAANGSNGTASITTGHATAVGNQSNTTINQTAHGQAHGQLGGILVINQDAVVTNSGVALANSGGNSALGNDSDNTSGLVQDANSDAGIAANSGAATNNSDGKATIATGGASATGNKSDTQVIQSATGSAGGALGGLVIIDQDAFVLNTGAAVANSGGNDATGNTSENDADVDQDIPGGGGGADPIGVASNNGEASNWSGGTGNVATGAATAIGNESKTTVRQSANADITGPGGASLISQDSNVINAGLAIANSGGNDALGNDSDNDANLFQDVTSAGATDVGVAGQFGLAENISDGTGSASSGAATAIGNRSDTTVEQTAKSDGGALNLQTQGNTVLNTGIGLANSGLNVGIGNTSENDADVDQEAEIAGPLDADVAVLGNFGLASNSSDGTGSVTTGAASAIGNDSSTHIAQTIDPDGVVVATQVAGVVNAGAAVANSGGNVALGNDSDNAADIDEQAIEVGVGNGPNADINVGTLVTSNNGEASNVSDGTASITTGAATATGNSSDTHIGQSSNGHIEGLGVVVNTQVAGVANVGVAAANSGLNAAVGNTSDNDAEIDDQDIEAVTDNGPNLDFNAGILTAANNGTASNASDGTASITTGAAKATGNSSATSIDQAADGNVDGLGVVLNTQVAGVLNAGVGIANSGGNLAIANASDNEADLDQEIDLIEDNGPNLDVNVFGAATAANSGTAENVSDGTATIRTGAADATGNASSTQLSQAANGDVDGLGLVVNTQVGGVANLGLGVANSGLNLAVGNVSDNADGANEAELDQDIELIADNGPNVDADVFGPLTAANSGAASNSSDGTAEITTGGAQGQGNVSSTSLSQNANGDVGGSGAAINTQVGGVLNIGAGVANSGLNAAVGNASENEAELDQDVDVADDNGPNLDLLVVGPLTANNSGEASNTSDGHAKVKTGGALATGNASATNLVQNQDSSVDGLGLVLGTQTGGVVNAGLAVANSGLNAAVANASDNSADADQDVDVLSGNGPNAALTVIGGLTANNSGEASNTSDGEACVCTGNAVASGNVSSTTLIQDLDLSTGSGIVVLSTTGTVVNAGLGIANSGLNLALGNISDNTATADQDAIINDAVLGTIVGPQVANNGGGATNSSKGTAVVGSGNASGTGNLSTTDMVQAAAVDSDLAFANITGSTTNAGFGLANSGLNLGIGNDSTNVATLTQTADGAGVVSNQGTAANDSDGTALINPDACLEDKVTPPTVKPPVEEEEKVPGKPGAGALPRTGGAIEAQAAIALMLLLAGFGLRRKGQRLA
jgi:hypothetical protein